MSMVLSILFYAILSMGSGAQWPDGCLSQKVFPCAIYSYKKTYFKLNENQFFLSKDTLIEFQSLSEATFVKGVVWVQANSHMRLKNPYGEILSKKEKGQFVIDSSEIGATVRVLNGQFDVKARASEESYLLSAGLGVSLGPVDYGRKMASISLPQVFLLKDYIKSIKRVFPFSEFNFQEHLEVVAQSVRKGLSLQAQWNQTIVEQKITDAHHTKVRQKYEAEYSSRRDSYLRSLFRQKSNFEDQ